METLERENLAFQVFTSEMRNPNLEGFHVDWKV
eukprot:COSAG01_NODE_14859_length_1402_cov_1.718342_1_plen_32_part_10